VSVILVINWRKPLRSEMRDGRDFETRVEDLKLGEGCLLVVSCAHSFVRLLWNGGRRGAFAHKRRNSSAVGAEAQWHWWHHRV
jgi:hypothetical protein